MFSKQGIVLRVQDAAGQVKLQDSRCSRRRGCSTKMMQQHQQQPSRCEHIELACKVNHQALSHAVFDSLTNTYAVIELFVLLNRVRLSRKFVSLYWGWRLTRASSFCLSATEHAGGNNNKLTRCTSMQNLACAVFQNGCSLRRKRWKRWRFIFMCTCMRLAANDKQFS